MRILMTYLGDSPRAVAMYQRLAATAPAGITVQPFNLAYPGSRAQLEWRELDARWRRRDPALLALYRGLQQAAEGCEVLFHYNGWNLHPEALHALPTFNVYGFFDDPESSAKQSLWVAPAFDAVCYGNIAAGGQYRAAGCRRTAHLPIFAFPDDLPEEAEVEGLLTAERDNEVLLVCGQSVWRRQRLAQLAAGWPGAQCFGEGWPGGRVSDAQLRGLYRRSRVGWNVHNSTGPINLRLFVLAAWGVLPVCDNRTGLARLFELGKEVVGFDTIPEALAWTRYYLTHEDERRSLAAAACRRFWNEYHPRHLWRRLAQQVAQWQQAEVLRYSPPGVVLPTPTWVDRWGAEIAARWARTVGKLNQRGRTWRLGARRRGWDERLYLGQAVTYTPGKKYAIRSGPRFSEATAAECDVLLWAGSAMLGTARRVYLAGEAVAEMQALLGPDRLREPVVEGAAEVVWAMQSQDRLSPAAWAARAPRAVVMVTPATPGGVVDGDAVYALLQPHYRQVTLAYLPDPTVPWLEPLEGPARVSAVVALGVAAGEGEIR